jgi:hypothetical protein
MLYQYAEVYGNNMLISDVAAQVMLKVDGRKVEGIAYDYANRQAGIELAEYGINAGPADKDVKAGLFKTVQYFHIDSRLKHPFHGSEGSPWYFISSACEKTIQDLLEYKYSKKALAVREGNDEQEVVRLTAHHASHAPDAIRYMLHTFRPLPINMPKPKKWESSELTPLSKAYWKEEAKHEDMMAGFVPRQRQNLDYQEWQKLAQKAPRRFQKVAYARFARF